MLELTAPNREHNMAISKPKRQDAVCAVELLTRSIFCLVLWAGAALCVQAQDAQPNNPDGSWTATTQTSVDNTNPSRTIESHAKSGDRSVDKQRVEVLGPDGRYQPDSDAEKETVRVNATTTRTVERTYKWDANGQRKLALVTEEEAQTSVSGDTQVIRTTSSSDANGKLQVVQREVANTKKTSPDAQETNTTVYFSDGNGGFHHVPANAGVARVQRRQQSCGEEDNAIAGWQWQLGGR